ncbi:MAG: MaoC family dehydratase [Sphingobium sp.]|nr:MaoC family dehydratase [Sphingobium sp.]MBP9157940.1 MaoC family dehydratase [Sphingobium sp.]
MTKIPISLEQYKQLVGQQIGVSHWIPIDQSRIDQFAEVTGDHQFIHVDPVAAAQTPFRGTIAHGFLSLAMLSEMGMAIIPAVSGTKMEVNYGLNTMRFLQPVRSGKRIRGSFLLKDLQERLAGQWQSTFAVTVEIEGEDKPALVVDWLILTIIS